jgi:hypothetical protein
MITNTTGKIMHKETISATAGSNSINIDCTKLSPGAYQLTSYATEGFLKTIQFIKQ